MVPSIFVGQPAMYRNRSAARRTSAAFATANGLPLSSDSSIASSSAFSSISSEIFQMTRPRCDAFMRRQGESSAKALRAARTARSMSSACPCATWASSSSVAGFRVANVLPDAASTHSPPISSLESSIND